MQSFKKFKIQSSFLSAVACMQIFTVNPDLVINHDDLGPAIKPAETAMAWRGSGMDMPPALAKAVAPLIEQGFYVMAWETSPANTGYMVDLYHSDPGRLGSQRDDFRLAASKGMGISLRRFIRP